MLPEWPGGTVAVLSTGAGEPHAIPVSTAVRAGPMTVRFALALRRESLARLREDPRCALTVLAAGDVAVTALGRATVVAEHERVAIVELTVERIQDHGTDRFVIDDGVQWRWTDIEAEASDAEVRDLVRDRPDDASG
jgi:flavin reductase (DIM6/NTAB) family NADH-FMN oxidoreductase RutF